MRTPRFFITRDAIDVQSRVVSIEDAALCSQLTNVLRMRGGESIEILDGEGSLYRCTLDKVGSRSARCTATIGSEEPAGGEPAVKLAIALPLLKSGRFEWAIEKLTEVGASEIVAIETARSVVRQAGGKIPADSLDQSMPPAQPESEPMLQRGTKSKRWQSIAREAAEQCERGLIPRVVGPVLFAELLRNCGSRYARVLICAERRHAPSLTELLAKTPTNMPAASLVVLVGPEGGFTENEFALAENAGAQPVTLGQRILRSETAALYAASLIIGCLDK